MQATLPLDEIDPCRLVVLAEDVTTQESALDACQRILARFDAELDFDVTAWRISDLGDLVAAHRAADALTRADILLLFLRGNDLAPETLPFLESAIERRSKRTGVLALAVVGPSPPDSPALHALVLRVSYLANRLRMDFLPPLLPEPVPGDDWMESPALRESAREGLGNNHWGLNE